MSISGKCDFQDTCSIFDVEDILNKYNIYTSKQDIIPLKMESEKDLVAYYPYIVGVMSSSKEEGGKIVLSENSFIDEEEAEHIGWRLRDLKRYYRKCKRNKVHFDKKEAMNILRGCFSIEEDYFEELINRVAELGEKATADGLHDSIHERMRKEWYELMLEKGWSEDIAYRWVYGWQRSFEKWKIKYKKLNDNLVQQELNLEET